MTRQPLARLVGRVQRTLATHRESDADLLARYRDGRDADALDALVRKHAPLVLAACRKVLPDADADDAFQATFLVLMREAGAIRKGQSVGPWLYGVAHRLALQARSNRSRRSRIEGRARMTGAADLPDLSWREACAILHQELDRLPDGYRLPLLLCYLDGKSRDEAAAELEWTVNRVRGQLERGRERLRKRLERRGIALSAGLLAAVAGNSVTAGVPPMRLIQSALHAAAGRPSAAAATLAHGGPPMFLPVKLAASAGLVCAAVVVGLCQTPPPTLDARQPAKADPAPKVEPAATKADPLAPTDVEVTGRVVDPDGKPLAGAKVTYQQQPLHDDPHGLYPGPSTGVSGDDGSFRFTALMHDRSAGTHDPLGRLTATAPGFAPAGTGGGGPGSFANRTLKLAKDDVPVECRFLDLEGKPVAGVTARCVYVIVTPDNDLGPWLKNLEENKLAGGATTPGIPIPASQLGITTTATSGKDGRIKLTGIGRGRVASARIDGPGIESRLVWLMTHDHDTVRVPRHPNAYSLFADQPVHGCKSDVVVGPCVPIDGVVTDIDTGKPIAGATVFNRLDLPVGWAPERVETTTDGQGRYRLNGRPNRTGNRVTVTGPKGEPYLVTADYPPTGEPGKAVTLNFKVKRGVFIAGRVTGPDTGRPLRAVVEYKSWFDNPNTKGIHPVWRSTTVSAADGTYELVGLPGRGLLTAKIDELRRGLCLMGAGAEPIKGFDVKASAFPTLPDKVFPVMVNALVEVDAKADGRTTRDIAVTTGKTVTGKFVDPDGKPLVGVVINGPIGAQFYTHELPKPEFTIPAINPAAPQPYFFYHRKKNLAAAVILKGDEPEGFAVKFQPAATITGRLLDADGEPLADAEIAGQIEPGQLNLKTGWGGFFYGKTDKEGKFRIAGLVPGVKVGARVSWRYQPAERIFAGRTFAAGEERDLGDVRVRPAE
jgi:RNA polymerase sigma factor (sigma-70 family)